MPIFVGLSAAGSIATRKALIRGMLQRPEVAASLRKLPQAIPLEITYPDKGRYVQRFSDGTPFTTGVDRDLEKLGVLSIYRMGDPADNTVKFIHGSSHSLQEMLTLVKAIQKLPEKQKPAVLLHAIQTMYFPGVPRDTVKAIAEKAGIPVKFMTTGKASARGIAATGNYGAANLMQMFGRLFKFVGSVLCGGHGTRLFGLRKLKGDIEFGFNNLTVWNIWTALYFHSQMPKGKDYHVMLANDGILIPFGKMTCEGRILSEIGAIRKKELSSDTVQQNKIWDALIDADFIVEQTDNEGVTRGVIQKIFYGSAQDYSILESSLSADEISHALTTLKRAGKAKDAYFKVAPDDSNTMSEADTTRFGMVALNSDGTFICASEKIGRAATFKMAQEILAAQGKPSKKERIRLYINYFGMETAELEKDIHNVLKTFVRPDLTADEIADLDTYSFTFAAISCDRPEEFRKNIERQGLNNLLAEPIVDKVLYKRLREALFDKHGVLRFGFAELNRGGIALDIGTVDSLFGFYMDLVRNYEPSGETRDKLLGYLGILEKGGQLTPAQQAEVTALEQVVQNTERIVRHSSQLIAGFDPTQVIENCEFEPDPINPPIIGVRTDAYTIPEEIQATGDVTRAIQDIISAGQKANLKEYRDARGRLLFLYDEQGIQTVKLVGCKIKPGAIIGRNVLGLNSEIESMVAENGAVVASRVEEPVAHKQANIISDYQLTQELIKIAQSEKGTFEMELPDGWTATFTLEGNSQSREIGKQFVDAARTANQVQQRDTTDLDRLERLLGQKKNAVPRIITLDMNDGIGRLKLGGQDAASNPARVFHFSVEFKRAKRPTYILYGREQTDPIIVDKNMAYASKQPVGNAPPQDYDVPFDADPAKTRLALMGGMVMKDARMQEDFGYYVRFRLRTNQELLNQGLVPEMAQYVEQLFEQLPAVASMPDKAITVPLVKIHTNDMEKAIEDALTNKKNLRNAIMDEIYAQTPIILAQYISKVSGIDVNTITKKLNDLQDKATNRNNRQSLATLYAELKIGDSQIQRQIRDIITGYPLSEMIFDPKTFGTTKYLTRNSFEPTIEALIEQFRMEEVPLVGPLNPDHTISVAMDPALAPEIPDPATDTLNLNAPAL